MPHALPAVRSTALAGGVVWTPCFAQPAPGVWQARGRLSGGGEGGRLGRGAPEHAGCVGRVPRLL